ncbi:MAG TPA: hypothetical protein VGJ27_03715 [Gaiellaceae bacterium]|jgi:hypothetical protein
MASDQSLEPPRVVEHGTTRAGRWLRARRTRIALWIAVIEGIIVAFAHDVSRWTVIAIAIPLLALYVVWGRNAQSDTFRQLTWIGGASQSLAVVVVVFSFFIPWLALIIAGVFAGIALLFLLADRR